MTVVDGELAAAIGENRKMVIFALDQVPEMTRGRGVRLQRYKEKGLSDVKTFKAADGLTWTDAAGRSFTLPMKELEGLARQARRCRPNLHPTAFLTKQQIRRPGRAGERQIVARTATKPTRTDQLATNSSEQSAS